MQPLIMNMLIKGIIKFLQSFLLLFLAPIGILQRFSFIYGYYLDFYGFSRIVWSRDMVMSALSAIHTSLCLHHTISQMKSKTVVSLLEGSAA